MKTIKEIKATIEEVLKPYRGPKAPPIKKSDEKKLNELKYILRYLETSPNEKFIMSEKERLSNSINILEDRFDEWRKSNPKKIAELKLGTDIRTYYRRESGQSDMIKQLKTINYILN